VAAPVPDNLTSSIDNRSVLTVIGGIGNDTNNVAAASSVSGVVSGFMNLNKPNLVNAACNIFADHVAKNVRRVDRKVH